MSSETWKLEKDLCRCCHAEGSFTSLAEPSQDLPQVEIVSEILRRCFDIDICPVEGMYNTSTYTICEPCILQLRDASNFKQQVLRCEERFRDMYRNVTALGDINTEEEEEENAILYEFKEECFEMSDAEDAVAADEAHDVSNNIVMSRPRRKKTNDSCCAKLTLRPRYNQPSYAPPNTSIDGAFMDITGNEKDRDESLKENISNLSNCLQITLEDISNCTKDLPPEGIDSDKETYFLNQIASNITVGKTGHIFVDNSDNTIIENSDTSYVLELSQYRNKMYVPQSESEESYLTKNHSVTSQSLSLSQATVPANMLELSTYHDKIYVPPIESVESYFTKNHTITGQSPDETMSICVADNDDPNYHIGNSSGNSEFDDSDRDETYNPASAVSSSDTSDTEETGDTLTNTECETRPLKRRCLQKSQDKTTSNTEEINTNDPKKKFKRIITKNHCFFCETDVSNFARHVIRNHTMECEVREILSYSKKSCTRKNLLTMLRKKGNYINNVAKCCKPMKKSNIYPDSDYLPCENCLGFYSRKRLWKHKQRCQPLSNTANTQVEAQNFMLRYLNIDKNLKEDVFPKMRPDKISLEAKKDTLICAFGAQYQRIHRKKNFINVTSRKMRDLAKLLIELKKLKPSIKDLMDSLKLQNYDLLVTATKKVSSYDDKTDRYGAPTYAMNINTSLKQCCKIAIMTTLKSDSSVITAAIEADLKTLIHLIESRWKFDVSIQAYSDLNLEKFNKITIVPLASDLKLLKDHLCEKAKSAASKLAESENSNIEAYTTLAETVYCRILLMNKRRPGELQRLLLSTYQECNNEKNAYEEYDRAISSAEKIFIKSFNCIVIRGKRGRGVPVLLTDEVQSDIDLLISVRSKYVSDTNHFLFAKPGLESTLSGYKVLEKYASACGAKNPKAITTTKLRKHLATLTQIFNLKETDIEQLANCMGHKQAVHRQNYRLPDDVYQTAKLSKLLLLMESGNADCYKGKSLDELDLDLEQDLLKDAREENDNNDDIMEYDAIMPTEEPSETNITDKVPVDTPKVAELCETTNATETCTKKKRNLVRWTPQQKNIVTKFFSKHIKSKQPPKRHECEELRDLHPDILHNKDWLKIKVYVQNTYTKKIK